MMAFYYSFLFSVCSHTTARLFLSLRQPPLTHRSCEDPTRHWTRMRPDWRPPKLCIGQWEGQERVSRQ